MGFRDSAIHCTKTCSSACKAISIIILLFGIGLIIGGIVLVAKYPESKYKFKYDFDDDYDDWSKPERMRATGIALIALGVFLLFCALCTACCAFQCGIFKRCLQSKAQDPIIEDQSAGRPATEPATAPYPASVPQQAPYPSQPQFPPQEPAYPPSKMPPTPPPQQPTMVPPQLPPNAGLMGPGMQPPSYYDAVGGVPTAPPAEDIPPEKM